LFAEVADFFGALVLDPHEANPLAARHGLAGGHLLDVVHLLPTEQPPDRLLDQRFPGFGPRGVAADHVLVGALQHVTVLTATAPRREHPRPEGDQPRVLRQPDEKRAPVHGDVFLGVFGIADKRRRGSACRVAIGRFGGWASSPHRSEPCGEKSGGRGVQKIP
jgi:hypothetical protein